MFRTSNFVICKSSHIFCGTLKTRVFDFLKQTNLLYFGCFLLFKVFIMYIVQCATPIERKCPFYVFSIAFWARMKDNQRNKSEGTFKILKMFILHLIAFQYVIFVPHLSETAYREFMMSWILGPDISISDCQLGDIFSLK